MYRFFGFLVLIFAFSLGVTAIPGCKDKDKAEKDKKEKAEKDKAEKDKADKVAADKAAADKAAADKAAKDGKGNDADSKFTITPPDAVSVEQGKTADVEIKVVRGKTNKDALDVKFDKLPEGVTAKDGAIAKEDSKATITLTAAADAKEVKDHEAKVWVGKEEVKLKVTVTKKK